MSTLFAWNPFVGGNGNGFTRTLRSNNWDYVIQWNLLACKHSKRAFCTDAGTALQRK